MVRRIAVLGLFVSLNVVLAQDVGTNHHGKLPPIDADCGVQNSCSMCVCEQKPTSRKAFACKCEEYCLPRCSLMAWLCGKCTCENRPCGEVRIRRRLVVEKVPGPEKKECVIREVPVEPRGPGQCGK